MALGVVSLLTDMSSEMIYPLLPVFLVSTLGAGAVALGLVEGIAEATASLLKVGSGWMTDRSGRRKPLVVAGYTISGAARPLIGLAGAWPMVAALRFADRIGKGIRTSPRDALIADVTEPSRRGAAFGLHRAMDHAGAVLGPLLAAALLATAALELRTVFMLAAVPAVAVVAVLWLGVVDRPAPPAIDAAPKPGLVDLLKAGDGDFKRLLAALFVFGLGNSSDGFLLLWFSEAGMSPIGVALVWAAHNAVKMVSATAAGRWTDRFGPRRLVAGGWLVYVAVYLSFPLLQDRLVLLVVIFLLYGVVFGFTEPSERAWVASATPTARGKAFGVYHGVVGLTAFPASVLFGWLYVAFGPTTAFWTGAGLAGCALLLLAGPPLSSGRAPHNPKASETSNRPS